MDDPFGNDPADIDDMGMAELVFEEIYMAILNCDGRKAAMQLRNRALKFMARGEPLISYGKDASSPDFWKKEI